MRTRTKIKKLNSLGFSHHLLLPVIVICAIAAIGSYIYSVSHADTGAVFYSITLGESTNGQSATKATPANLTGCWFTGRIWDSTTTTCTQKCRLPDAKLVAQTSSHNAYCQGHINPAGNITQVVCNDQLHRLWINNTGCARRADQENGNDSHYCPDPKYPNYQAQTTTDRCVAATIANTGSSTPSPTPTNTNQSVIEDPLDQTLCRQLGRIVETNGKCKQACQATTGVLYIASDAAKTKYCSKSLAPGMTATRCNELHRLWVNIGCTRRADQTDSATGNALYCQTGYPYYNANSDASSTGTLDVCEKSKAIADQNEAAGIIGGKIICNGGTITNGKCVCPAGQTIHDGGCHAPSSSTGTAGAGSSTGDNPAGNDSEAPDPGQPLPTLTAGWTRSTSQAACIANGRIWDTELLACSWRKQGEQRSDACQNGTYTYVKRSKGNDTCITPGRTISIVKHTGFALHNTVCHIPIISHRKGCQTNTDGNDAPPTTNPTNNQPSTVTFSFQNLGRAEQSSTAVWDKIKQSLGDRTNVVYNFVEIDEGDSGEHTSLQKVFGDKGWSQFGNTNPTLNRLGSDWTMVKSSKILLHHGGETTDAFKQHGCRTPSRWLVVSQFKETSTGVQVATINTHFITHAYNHPQIAWCQQYWDLSWHKLQDEVAALHESGYNVVVTGDFNHNGNLPFLHAGTKEVAHHGPDRILALPAANRKMSVDTTGIVDTPSGEVFHRDLWARLTFN